MASIFRDYGYRRLRSRARLKFLVADWGVEKFREVLENEYLQPPARLLRLPAPRRSGTATTSACTEQQDGKLYVGDRPDRRPGLRHACWSGWPT